jgi:putative membrane protein insertion efficiency factor
VGVKIAVCVIHIYRLFVAPLLGPRCRFYPSCSQYGLEVFRKYGFLKGASKTVVRLCKCHPFHPGGVDLP